MFDEMREFLKEKQGLPDIPDDRVLYWLKNYMQWTLFSRDWRGLAHDPTLTERVGAEMSVDIQKVMSWIAQLELDNTR